MASLASISADLKSAMLARETDKVGTLRLLLSELKNLQIKKGEDLSDDEVLQTVRREIKKRQDTASLYTQQGQSDRADQELGEVSILSIYLPPAIDPATIETFIKDLMATLGTPTPQHRGQIMKDTLAHFGTSVDGRTVNEIVSRLL